MKDLKEFFDDFNIHARITPALISVLPVYLYLIIIGLNEFRIIEVIKNSFIAILLIALYYRIVRNLGKNFERKMYKELGGKPTTIVLRYSDNNFDEITKTRYHKKLNKKIANLNLPTSREEERQETDILYESAINWLRNYANTNRIVEERTYQELKDYNFWRNLYGSKWIIVLSCVICIIIEVIRLMLSVNNLNELSNYIINVLIMSGICIFLCIVINKKTVKNKAFDYAKTLVEVCERI